MMISKNNFDQRYSLSRKKKHYFPSESEKNYLENRVHLRGIRVYRAGINTNWNWTT